MTEYQTIDDISGFIESLGGILVLAPAEGDGTPEIAWGDRFFYYAPDGVLPQGQPFATIVTKDYPGEPSSGLDRDGAFRVNIGVTPQVFAAQTGRAPKDPVPDGYDPAAVDEVIAHPVYASMAWVAVVSPGPRTDAVLRELLRGAWERARRGWGRKEERG